jgi:importin subunit beta-1
VSSLDTAYKSQIKQAILYSLGQTSSVVRTQVASAIASIAKIEIPRREWLDLIPSLCANSTNENIDIRNAALQTLQLICEELQANEITDEVKNMIILALVNNITLDPNYTKSTTYATKGLFYAIPYAAQNFKVEGERNYIMEKVFLAIDHPDEEIKVAALQTLVEIGRLEYESIQFYFQKVCEVTARAARSAEENVGAQGIEFWTSLAEEEMKRKKSGKEVKGYIMQCHTDLIQLLMECTLRLNIHDEDDDNDEWGVALSAGCCLDKVA